MEPLGYYKWHWQAWRANRRVQRMSWQARGLYRELLDEFWAEGFLKDDLAYMAEVCGCSLDEMKAYWPEIAPCFELRGGELYNRKMDEQRTSMDALRVANASAGRTGAIAKLANAKHSPDERQADASERHIERREEREEKRESKRVSVPEPTPEELEGTGITVEDYRSHQAVRKLKKSPFSSLDSRNRWIELFRRYYAEGKDTSSMMNLMIASNWIAPVPEKWTLVEKPKREKVLLSFDSEQYRSYLQNGGADGV